MKYQRRKFISQLVAGSVAGLALPLSAVSKEKSGISQPASPEDEAYWQKIQQSFNVPASLRMMNAANLCPSPKVVHDRVLEFTNAMNKDVSMQWRSVFAEIRKNSLKALEQFTGAEPGEIGITRNTSESNCIVAHGLDLKAGDEVVVWEQNHPSNREVWLTRAKRAGFTVKQITVPANPASADDLIDPFNKAITPQTRLISFSHISNLSGVALPVREICKMAKAKGIMTLVDGAQSLGLMEVNVRDMGCSFYTSSMHKWLMGPLENGILYVNKEYFSRLWPNVVGGGWKEAKTVDENLCVLGQRNDPSATAIPETIEFHNAIGRKNIENRVVKLNTYLKTQLRNEIPQATFVTPWEPSFSAGIVIINLPGKDAREVTDKLYRTYRIASAAAGGGIRFSPHIYNMMKDIDYVANAVAELAK
jgi:isopenicillin-N epimerase